MLIHVLQNKGDLSIEQLFLGWGGEYIFKIAFIWEKNWLKFNTNLEN